MMSSEYESLRFAFCSEPEMYFNNLRFEVYSEDDSHDEEILTMYLLSYSASVNYPGLRFAVQKTLMDRRKPSGEVWRQRISLGPVFNSGYAYQLDQQKPEPDADCIVLTAEIQLTSGRGANVGSRHHVVAKAIINDKIEITKRTIIVVREHPRPFLLVNLGLVSPPVVNVRVFFVDVHAQLSEQSTLECHKASFWLLHGGMFTVNVAAAVDFISARVNLVPVSNGTGVRVFDGGIYFGVSGVIRLVLRPLPHVELDKDVNVDVGGILRCYTYRRPQDNRDPIFNPPIYFSQTVRLVKAAGVVEHCSDCAYLRLKPCQVRVFGVRGDFADILLHSDNPTRHWTTHARGGYHGIFRTVTVLFGQVAHISAITVKIKENGNKPRSMVLDGTRDGKSFYFLRKVNVMFQMTSPETNVTFDTQPGVRGLRITLSDLVDEDEVVHLKMGFYGWLESKTEKDFDPCRVQTSGCSDGQCAASVALRSYVAGRDFIVLCDLVPDALVKNQIHSTCFRAFDSAPTRWRDLDSRIAHVVHYIPKENVLLATSGCGKEFFLSKNSGETWVSIDRRHFLYWKTYLDTRPMVSIPWTILPPTFQPLSTGPNCTAYQVRQWHFCYDGVYHGNRRVVDWNDCCQI
uniref:VPS10 domain-containing protein n=1 Tax=Mesocestoides corti TaxID=53468 RepID=A0A5K3FRG8_MESCO